MDWKERLRRQQAESSWDGKAEWQKAKQESINRGWQEDLTEEIYFRKRFDFIFRNKIWDDRKFPWDSQNKGWDFCWKSYLFEMFPEHVKTWWNPKHYDSYVFYDGDMSFYEKYADSFDVWFDKSKVDWTTETTYLLEFNRKDFRKWWDEASFDWKYSLFLLTEPDLVIHHDLWMNGYKNAILNDGIKDFDQFLNWGM